MVKFDGKPGKLRINSLCFTLGLVSSTLHELFVSKSLETDVKLCPKVETASELLAAILFQHWKKKVR
jgi:hypothetical protein